VLLVASLVTAGPGAQDRGDPEPLPELARVARVFAEDGAELDLDRLLDALAAADVVFCGETHLDEVTHRVELFLYEGLLQRREGKVVLALEMFATDAQPVLDEYVQGRCDEASFLARSRPWSNYRTGYRPLVERARRDRLPVVAANAPAALTRRVASGGAAAFAALDEAERNLLPLRLLPTSEAYWKRVARATRGHVGAGGATDPERLLYSTQSLWDNTMGWSAARALQAHPDALVLHVLGAFHAAHRQGTVEQLLQRAPDAKVVTVGIEPVRDLALPPRLPLDADFVVRVEARARDVQDGFLAVHAAREHRYRLHAPPGGPKPLLLWLPAAGLRAEDGVALWQRALGDEAIVAVLEAPYAEVGEDLARGGRWFWPETFDADTGALAAAIARTRAYVEHWYPVDAGRVVLAGEGEGATVVASAALWGRNVARAALAFAPRSYRKLAERGLPDDPADVGSLRVFADGEHAKWWQRELEQHGERAPDAEVAAERDVVGAVRAALGLPARAAAGDPVVLVARASDAPRARAWAALAAAGAAHAGRPVRQVVVEPGAAEPEADLGAGARALAFPGEWPAEVEAALTRAGVAFLSVADAERAGLPPAPGPFGGTTILVVPAGAPEELRAQWRALAERNPMHRYGRFFRLEVVLEDGDRTLADALQAMVEARRSNALVVPASFCADAAYVRALRAQAAPFLDRVDVTWLPGLGGRIALALGF